MHKLLLLRLYVKRFGLIISIVIVCNLLLSFILVPLLNSDTKQSIANDMIYYEGEDVSSYQHYAIDNNLEYDLTPAVHGKKDFIYAMPPDTIEPIYLYDLNYLRDTTKDLVTSNLDILNKDNEKFIDLNQIYLSFFPSEINDYKVYNERLEVKEVLVGDYPTNESEILIPELYAISLANKFEVDSYDKLIGQKINLLSSEYSIVGVYSGANHIIAYPSKELITYYQQYLDQGIFIKFANKQQKSKLFDNFDSNEFVNSSEFYLNNIKFYMPQVLEVVILVLAIIFISVEQKQYVVILNHHKYAISNYLIPLIIPVFGILMVTMFL